MNDTHTAQVIDRMTDAKVGDWLWLKSSEP